MQQMARRTVKMSQGCCTEWEMDSIKAHIIVSSAWVEPYRVSKGKPWTGSIESSARHPNPSWCQDARRCFGHTRCWSLQSNRAQWVPLGGELVHRNVECQGLANGQVGHGSIKLDDRKGSKPRVDSMTTGTGHQLETLICLFPRCCCYHQVKRQST